MSLRIALIGNAASTMVRFRGPLIKALQELGHEVFAICPSGSIDEEKALLDLGVHRVKLEQMSRQGLNPKNELSLLKGLTKVLRDIEPDRVFSYFLKPAIWGSLAAKKAGVPRCVAMIEGMGYAFSSSAYHTLKESLKQKVIRSVVLSLIRYAGRRMDHLIVLNDDDAELVNNCADIKKDRLTVLDGIGIDLEYFAPEPSHKEPVRFVLAARLVREKGIELFFECAARVKAIHPSASFRLLGGVDNAPGAMSAEEIEKMVSSGLIEWPGHVNDIRPHMRESSVFVLPTLYREGLPRSTMEAMAMARPVITSDMPGARGSVTHGVSGFIHPAGDLEALVSACLHFCENPQDIERMGKQALSEATRRYAIDIQNKRQCDLIIGLDSI